MASLIETWKKLERFLNQNLAYFFANGNKLYRIKEYERE